jgi:hypothetical protein
MFQNLPFIQAALKGNILPGFTGLPSQLGGGAIPQSGGGTSAAGGGTPASGGSSGGGSSQMSVPSGETPVNVSGTPSSGGGQAQGTQSAASFLKSKGVNSPSQLKPADRSTYMKLKGTGAASPSAADSMAAQVGPAASQAASSGDTNAGTTIDFSRGLGVNMPDTTSITQRGYENMSDQEKVFLGALYQSEKGVPAAQALQQITRSFIPTTGGTVSAL